MIRMLVLMAALLAVPFVVYFIYDIARRGPDGRGPRSPRDWERDSVLNLGFIGLFLAVIGIAFVLITGGGSRDGVYVPARIDNGKLIDGGFTPKEDPQTPSIGTD